MAFYDSFNILSVCFYRVFKKKMLAISSAIKCDLYSIKKDFLGTYMLTLTVISGDPYKYSDQIA